MVSKLLPCGHQVVTKWSQSCHQMVTKLSHLVKKCSPSGYRVVTERTQRGHQVVSWSPSSHSAVLKTPSYGCSTVDSKLDYDGIGWYLSLDVSGAHVRICSSSNDQLMINWWSTDDELMINWWWTDDELMMNWWWTALSDEIHIEQENHIEQEKVAVGH